jgi:hypothetical protein
MKAALPLLVILPLSLCQAPIALAGSQSLLDPYASVDAPAAKKGKTHTPKKEAVTESILDEASSSQPEQNSAPKHAEKAPKAPKTAKAPKAPKIAKAPKPPKPTTTASTTGGGVMTNLKNMEVSSAKTLKSASSKFLAGSKSASTKLVEGSKTAGGKIAEKTKTLSEHLAAGAKTSGEYLKKGATAMGHGIQKTTGKVKETASALEHKVKPGSTAIAAKPSSAEVPGKPLDSKPLDTVPSSKTSKTKITSRDGFPGKPLEPLSDKPIGGKHLLTGAFSKFNPFASKKPPMTQPVVRPISPANAAAPNFPSSAPTPAPSDFN